MSEYHQRMLEEVSKVVSEAPKLFAALGNDSWN
jgi:hypothetical protein